MKKIKRKRKGQTKRSKLWQKRSWRLAKCAGCWLGPHEVNSTYCSNVRVHLLRANGGLKFERAYSSSTHHANFNSSSNNHPTISESRNGTAKVILVVADIKIFFARLAFVFSILSSRHRSHYADATSLPYLSDTRHR